MYRLTCIICNKEFEIEKIYRNGRTTCSTICRCNLRKRTNLLKYGVSNVSQSSIIQEKKKSTVLENYGSNYYFQTEEFKSSLKEKMMEKFGVEHNSQSDIIKKKKIKTMIEKYGAENPSQISEFQIKKIKTSINNTGFEHPSQSASFKEQVKNTNIKKYGYPHRLQQHICRESFDKLNDPSWLSEQNKTKSSVQIGKELNVSYGVVLSHFRKNNLEYLRHNTSLFEEEIIEFISANSSYQLIRNTREYIGKEIDILLPELNFGIECNGTYWHSEIAGNKDKNYHLDKSCKGKEKNIAIFHVWEHEWKFKKQIIQSMILSRIGKAEKIYARKCILREVSTEIEKEFLNNNHLQGYVGSSLCYGLYYENELVSLMSFGKNRFRKNTVELLRFCNKLGHTVVGGSSRLFKNYISSSFVDIIISYSHRDKFTGNLYQKLGFKYSHSSSPSYYYTKDYINFENRLKYQKHKLPKLLNNFNPDLTEWENMQNNGFDRIWDCGNDVWVWERTNSDK